MMVMSFAISCGTGDGNVQSGDNPSADKNTGYASDELVGSYSLQLKESDLSKDPPPELAGAVGGWTDLALSRNQLSVSTRP